MTNPYVEQTAQQTGATASEVRKSARPARTSLEKAQSLGYATVEEYEEALHEFLNAC